MQARASEPFLDIGLSEGGKEGLVKSCNEVLFCNMEDMISDEVLVLFGKGCLQRTKAANIHWLKHV